MKNFVVSLFFALSPLSFANEVTEQINDNLKKPEELIFLSYCSHFGTGVSYSFSSCINSNFSNVQREIGGFFPYCMNIGNDVSYSFVSCVNSGFREAQRQLQNNVWMQDCYNFDRTSIDFSFVSCVNSNFNTLTREINRQ